MIHVPDVRAAVAWYEAIGFVTRAVHEEAGCPMDWASLWYGATEVIEGLHCTGYGMREFIIRDLNGFWITFGQQVRDE